MSLETAPRTDTEPDNDTHDTETVVERPDNRHASPTAHALDRAALFLQERADRLEARAIGNAHEEALDEYRSRDLEGYANHMHSLTEAADAEGNPVEAQREYATNRLTSERNADHTAALAEYRRQDREGYRKHLSQLAAEGNDNETSRNYGQRKLDTEKVIDMPGKAARALRRFARTSLNVLRGAGLIGLGVTLLAGEGISRRAAGIRRKNTAETNKKSRKERRAERREANKTERERKQTADRLERQRLARAAAARKAARRKRWAESKPGRGYRATANFSRAQRARVGRFGRRTGAAIGAAGGAFSETWKNYGKTTEDTPENNVV